MSYNKRLLVTEDEKKYILNLYNILLEQQTTDVVSTEEPIVKVINFKDSFRKGYYSEKQIKPDKNVEFQQNILSALEFLQKYPNNDITVKIIASEDKDPNYDHEKDPYNPTPLPLKGLAGLKG